VIIDVENVITMRYLIYYQIPVIAMGLTLEALRTFLEVRINADYTT